MLTSGLQYVIQRINYKRDLERIELIVNKAKSAAWGPKLVPVSGRRKVNFFLAPIVFFLSERADSLTHYKPRFVLTWVMLTVKMGALWEPNTLI
jgi:hypothetical protein